MQNLNFQTYNVKISLYFGAQLLFFIFVTWRLFLSDRCGPIKFTSTNGLNVCALGHFKSLVATTESKYQLKQEHILICD